MKGLLKHSAITVSMVFMMAVFGWAFGVGVGYGLNDSGWSAISSTVSHTGGE